jgi:hypothetical protein
LAHTNVIAWTALASATVLRLAIGELVLPMIKTWPEFSYPVIKLSQFAISPATIHYDAVYGIFQYL